MTPVPSSAYRPPHAADDDLPDVAPAMPHAMPCAEDLARADHYALIARLLLAPPDADLLSLLSGLRMPAELLEMTPMEEAWHRLGAAAQAFDAAAARAEFDDLFTGMGTPLLNPFGSLYQSGYLHDVPLAALREDLARLGLARRSGIGVSEDHLGVLCETMRLLIAGHGALPPQTLQVQRRFFERHIAPWHVRCLEDIRDAAPANLYRVVAGFALVFLGIEAESFGIEEGDAGADDNTDAVAPPRRARA